MSARPDIPGWLARIRSLTISSGALVDDSTLHDEGNLPKASEIGQGITLDRDDVGILSGRKGSHAVLQLHQLGGGQRGGSDGLHWSHAVLHHIRQLHGVESVGINPA